MGLRAQQKSINERKLMAIVFSILRWKHYLMGRKFVVRTDQFSLKFILEQQEIRAEYQKWVMKLMGFDFTIQYDPGKSNTVVDALRRREGDPTAQLELCTALGSISID